MCGIAGVVGMELEVWARKNMANTMRRRGPDADGMFVDGDCCLLHSRLAIIDPEGGKQPMELHWQGEDYCLVYNGELYNTSELRRELERLGHTFHGHSDTEVLLHAYAQYGEKCLDLLNGIFGFAVWERRQRRLFLARDRIGVKPLFYTLIPQGIVFASEIKTILAAPGIRAKLDGLGAAELLLLGPGRIPGSGVFQGICELEPGMYGLLESGKFRLRRYWKLTDREHRENFEDTLAHVRFLVEDAICRQMVSDVEIGTFLSGGLDSSIITAICAREMAAKGQRLRTFSVDYQHNQLYFQPGKFQPDADSDYIEIMSTENNTIHKNTILTAQELSGALETATMARDLPGMADVDFSLLLFCGQIRKDVKVALSGECADEIFGGYPWYRDDKIRSAAGFPWAQNLQQRGNLLNAAVRHRVEPEDYVLDLSRDTCRESDVLPGTSPEERRMKEMVNLNFRWFMQTLLDRKDRMSMYHALEVRVPFCDHRIAEYMYGVPWQFKDHMGREKGLLRKAVKGLIPESIRMRRKSPYPKTFDPAYERIMEARLQERINSADSAISSLICRKGLKTLLEEESPWPWYGQLMRRPQLLAYLLQIDFWLTHYRVELLF